jgi:hypothetical protein
LATTEEACVFLQFVKAKTASLETEISTMVNHCANPECCKPLHYLRDGRIFVFEVPNPLASSRADKSVRRMEHFWLCGDCSESFTLEQSSEKNVSICPRPMRHRHAPVAIIPTAIAS